MGRADRVTPVFFFAVKAFAVMQRRYLSCTVSRCAELPPSFNSSNGKNRAPASPSGFFKPKSKEKSREPRRYDAFKLDVSNQRFRKNAKPKATAGTPWERKISRDSFRIAEATSYKLLRDVASLDTVVEGARGGRILKSMVERAQAKAMVMNEPKIPGIPFLELSEDAFQDLSFTPGTFIETRRFAFLLFFFFFFFFHY